MAYMPKEALEILSTNIKAALSERGKYLKGMGEIASLWEDAFFKTFLIGTPTKMFLPPGFSPETARRLIEKRELPDVPSSERGFGT